MMKDVITTRRDEFNNLIALKFSPEELNAKFLGIQQIITLIGENDNYTQLIQSFDGIDEDDMSIDNARELRTDFLKQLIEQLSDFGIHLQPIPIEKLAEKKRTLSVSQAA
jgi:hypothetical protein